MSLIDDALRRVNDPTVKSVTEHPGKPAQAKPAELPDVMPQAHSWQPGTAPRPRATAQPRRPSAAGTGLAIAALFAIGSALLIQRHISARKQAHLANAHQDAEPVDAKEPASNMRDGLLLSGIVEGNGAPYAMLNGAIVAVGESVQGWTLVEIGAGTARLRSRQGRDITLNVPR